MCDGVGMFEHADHATPRREHGYCTDDMARLLIVASREPDRTSQVRELTRTAFRFLVASQSTTGRTRNRRDVNGQWSDEFGLDDCWGRSVWAFGTATRRSADGWMRTSALAHFNRAVQQRSPHRRAMAFAALGAAEVAEHDPTHARAQRLLADAVAVIGRPAGDKVWPWPEPRLSYANAAVAESLIAAGHALDRREVLDDGLTLLGWLLARETVDGHLSPTPVGGGGRDDRPQRFDQQPIEIAAMADACARAYAVTGDERWRRGVEAAIAWFGGDNDGGALMWDPTTQGGFDGLTPTGPNVNQGAESTLALIATLQYSAR